MIGTPSPPDPAAPPAAFKRRGHIVLALLAVLVLVGFVPLATMSWKLIETNRETLTTAQQQIQLLTASSIAHEVDMHVEGLRSQLARVAQTLSAAVRRSGSIPSEEIRQVLSELTGGRLSYVRYTYFEGNEVRSVEAGQEPADLEPLFVASLQQAAEGVAAWREEGAPSQPILSDPILLPATPDSAVVAMAAPVVSGRSFRGVLTALIDFERVWVVARRSLKGQLLFALDERGIVFASSDPEQVPPGQEVRNSALVERFLSDGRASQTMPFMLERRGEAERYIGAFERTGQGWGIFVQAPDRDVYWTVRHMERMTRTWTLGLLALAALAAIYFARNLSDPINRLAAASRALARGDFSARVAVSSRNEIGELAHAFNRMAGEIEDYVRRLREAFQQKNELFLDTIRALAEAIDAKDPYTRGHSVRVNRYSVILARELRLSSAEIRDIYVSSLLHDVGKIGIEDSILKKTGALTPAEFEIIKTHTVKGASIMAPIRQMKNMIPGIRHHHERCDGSGYPDGLRRDETPLMARIIAVADTFDAITTARPYQQPMTFDAAIRRINELKGPALDDQVVDAFNQACLEGRIRLDGERDERPPGADFILPAEQQPALAAPITG